MRIHLVIHFIIHEAFEAPAAIAVWAKQNGYQLSYSKVYQHDPLPAVEDFDALIVMGGPQSPDTTLEECPYFNAQAEIELIRQAVEHNKHVLGVCLGAQLMGEAFGAKVERSPHKEIGVFKINLTKAATESPLFAGFPESFHVGHWHGDMPGLTEGAEVLAFSPGCPRQIVKYAPRAYGFQCHLEFNKQVIDLLIEHCGHELNTELPFVQSPEVLRRHDYDSMNQWLFTFLNRFMVS